MNIDKYILKNNTSFDKELYAKFTKSTINDIALGNFSRLALDKVKACTTMEYPETPTNDWSLSNQVVVHSEVVVMSVEELKAFGEEVILDYLDNKKELDILSSGTI